MTGAHYTGVSCDNESQDESAASLQPPPPPPRPSLLRASLLVSTGLLLASVLLLWAKPSSSPFAWQERPLLNGGGVSEPLDYEEGEAGTGVVALGKGLGLQQKWFMGSRRRPTTTSTTTPKLLSSVSSLSSDHPINAFNDKLDSVKFQGTGLYYGFISGESQVVWEGEVEGREGSYTHKTTEVPLASASKLWTGLAAMRTMELRNKSFYPGRRVNTFPRWKDWKFHITGSGHFGYLTIHQLLTHTSGLPFAMRDSKEDVRRMKLFYKPGTKFGYTLGHRVIGWLLRDFWMSDPEGAAAGIKTVQDTYKWLVFEPLQLSEFTKFSNSMTHMFGAEGDAGDAAIQSTGEDMAKLAVLALRRGKLPNGVPFISRKNWDKWAVPNLLPGGKLSKDLVDWRAGSATWANWNTGGQKEAIMKQSGEYGWNYFGATYYNSKEIGWCGFFSSCLRVSYTRGLAFIMMQRDTADLKHSKPYLVQHFDAMAKSLQCEYQKFPSGRCPNTQLSGPCKNGRACNVGDCCLLGGSCRNCPFGAEPNAAACSAHGGSMCSSRFCEKVTEPGWFSRAKTKHEDLPWTAACPYFVNRYKSAFKDKRLNPKYHTCYMPRCSLMHNRRRR